MLRQSHPALTLPYPCDASMFPRQQAIPWIARESPIEPKNKRDGIQLTNSATIVLLGFGGLGLDRLPMDGISTSRDNTFSSHRNKPTETESNLLSFPATQSQYQDLVCAVDAIVTKPGYGIVADVLAQRVPILYTDRGDFPEYPQLVAALSDCATAEFIPQQELLAGNLAVHLQPLAGQAAPLATRWT